MTRVVAGTAGGRTLRVPTRGTRPTSERVREALFSRLEHLDAVAGARVLDLYAGSGALGIEAASRGAAAVTLVDSARVAVDACRANVAALRLPLVTVVGERAERFVQRPVAAPWDLVLIDPPYDLDEDVLAEVLARLAGPTALDPDGVVVVERSSRSPEPRWPTDLGPTDRRAYGETVVWFASPDASPDETHASSAPGSRPR
ncbi:RsmD family RNA methyltransferase [Cellulomonas fimi]|uniref:Methyltransferase n=1 Tax=Cellulomonas fimi TaxID=1708 RepID=A0A7Y0QIR8_CELFI|nr:RsmD family RNA methyltransferase [Cellulomonas fimi]NMR21179.1 methyltransferase [Cellulomonas fimi]